MMSCYGGNDFYLTDKFQDYKNLFIDSFKRELTNTLNAVSKIKQIMAISTLVLFSPKTKIIPDTCPTSKIIPCEVDSGAGWLFSAPY